MRLSGGRGDFGKDPGPMEGRVEVHYRGAWGTICDDDFGIEEGHVSHGMKEMHLSHGKLYVSHSKMYVSR